MIRHSSAFNIVPLRSTFAQSSFLKAVTYGWAGCFTESTRAILATCIVTWAKVNRFEASVQSKLMLDPSSASLLALSKRL
jgi:hypothetical protein